MSERAKAVHGHASWTNPGRGRESWTDLAAEAEA